MPTANPLPAGWKAWPTLLMRLTAQKGPIALARGAWWRAGCRLSTRANTAAWRSGPRSTSLIPTPPHTAGAYSRQQGGFDEALQVDEDQELSFRLAEAGAHLVFAPEAVVYHKHVATPLAYIKRKFRIGYWKVLVAAMHPARIISDSHTPQSLKAQMALLALVLLLLPAAPFSRLARKALAIAAGTLLATTLPIAARIAADDPVVALAAPLMSLLRAAGLLAGTPGGPCALRSTPLA